MTDAVLPRRAALAVASGQAQTSGSNFTAAIAHVALFTGICLQRFGIPFGPTTVSLSLPVLLLLAIWMAVARRGYVPALAAMLFALFAGWALLSTLVATTMPDKRVGFSILSLLELLLLYLPLLVRPRGDFDVARMQRIFLFYVRLCAVCGIAQFGLQFAHIRLFSWVQLVPGLGRWTLESAFAVISPIRYGSPILRSNGFFLLEPSIFSQLLAFGIMLDLFILGRRKYLPLYTIAYLTSYSGTGLLSLGITLLLISLASLRNAARTLQVGMAALLALALFSAILPDQVATFLNRAGELGSSQTSAHARYLAQFAEVQAFAGESRSLIGYGPGATGRAVSFTAGSGNAALQLFVDYGIVGLCLFVALLLNVFWQPQAAGMALLLLVNFELGGGYLLMPPMVLLMVVSGLWGLERTSRLGGAPALAARRRTGCYAGQRHRASLR